jgi:diaminopropionate ammonia-lyase
MEEPEQPVRVAVTPTARYAAAYSDEASHVLSHGDLQQAKEFVQLLPSYEPTPLLEHNGLADDCDVASVLIKHEGHRLPTRSFKVLGPPYALARQLLARLDRRKATQSDRFEPIDLTETGRLAPLRYELLLSSQLTSVRRHIAAAATSGNHGRALAWAATQFGCPCRIYMPESTGAFREAQIKQFGAETVRVAGNYDDAVKCAVLDSDQRDYILVGDGARPDGGVLRHIIHGFSIVGEELVSACCMPTHVFIPAGSGSLAAAITARLWMAYGAQRPKIVIVQPHAVDSAYQSCVRGLRTASQGDLATVMDGLSVRELSSDAWAILFVGAFAFITIPDHLAISMLRRCSADGEPTIGETGIAALAGFQAAANDPNARQRLDLNRDSRVILVATEGVTDPPVLNRLLTSQET